jgi:hypothetical protein
MKKLIFSRALYRIIFIVGGCILLLLTTIIAVLATTTPQLCDPSSKYYCSKVVYTDQGNNVLITDRNWRGAIDGGADYWQVWYVKDWEWVSGAWQWRESWGPSSWRTNVTLSSWDSYSADRTRIKNSCVTMKFRFQECAPDCYYWCSGRHEHYLFDNHSNEVLPANCNP